MSSRYPSVTARNRANRASNNPGRGIARAANDNRMGVVRIRSTGARAAVRIAPRLFGRLIPVVGWGFLAYDAYQLYQWLQTESTVGPNPAQWDLVKNCPYELPVYKVCGYDYGQRNPACGIDYGKFGLCSTANPNSSGWPSSTLANKLFVYGDLAVDTVRLLKVWQRKPELIGLDLPLVTVSEAYVATPVPALVPGTAPLAWPNPAALPVPFEAPLPHEEPSGKPDPAPAPNPARVPDPYVLPQVPWPFVYAPPATSGGKPVVPPSVEFSPDGSRPIPGPSDAPPDRVRRERKRKGRGRKPPRRGRRRKREEYKTRSKSRIVGLLWMGLNWATEGMDFVNAMYDSISDEEHKLGPRASRRQIFEYMMTDFEPWLHVNAALALNNFIDMQAQDVIDSSQGKLSAAASARMGSPIGLGFRTSNSLGRDDHNEEIIAPTVDIDEENGFITFRGAKFIERQFKAFRRNGERK